MKPLASIALAIVAALSLAACESFKVNQLDREFVDIYSTKVSYQQAEGMFGVPDGVNVQFADLSERAFEAAESLGDDEIHQKIGFLRIASVAAWQAGPAGKPADAAVAGQAACETLEANPDSPQMPRDCIMIQLAAPLHRQDELSRKLNNYLDQERASSVTDPESSKADLFEVVEGASCQMLKVTLQRENSLQKPVPVAFWQQVDRQRLHAYCDASIALAQIRQLRLPADEVERRDKANAGLRGLTRLIEESYREGGCQNIEGMAESWRYSELEALQAIRLDLGDWPPNCRL